METIENTDIKFIEKAIQLPKYNDLSLDEAVLLNDKFQNKDELKKTAEGEYYIEVKITKGTEKLLKTSEGKIFEGLEKKGYGYIVADDFTAKDKLFEFTHAVRMYKEKTDDKFYKEPQADDKFYIEEKELGGAVDGKEVIQTPYYPISESCNTLDTVVPNSMAVEQKKFNQRFKSAMAELGTNVDAWVAKKLQYKSAEELCTFFAQEQIDAIGTAIWNHETNEDAIIIADQTGTGKGRSGAGLLRYAILNQKVIPFFFTEKKHLLNDLYRDLIDIGFDAGIPYKFKKLVDVEKTEFTDQELLEIIIEDIKDKGEVRVEYAFNESFNLEWLRKEFDETNKNYDVVETVKAELIDLYRQHIIENGLEREVFEVNPDYDRQVVEALRKGKHLVYPFVPNRMDIKDIDGNILYPAMTENELKEILKFKKDGKKWAGEDMSVKPEDLQLPSKYKLFAMPYSQIGTAYYDFNGQPQLRNRIKLFQKYIQDSVLVLDESHTASGLDEATGELSNTGELIFEFIKNAKMTTYLSATYAKRASSMPLYALKTSIRESGLSDMEMIDGFRKGGNALQEAVSAELTRNGQLLRREKVIQGKSNYYYEDDKSEVGLNQIEKLNRIAGLYQLVKDFADEVRGVITEYKSGLTAEEKAKIKPARGVNAMAFQLFNFMLLSLKVRQTTEFAIKNLKQGKKTVITVASTLESALDNLSKTFMSNTTVDSYKIGDTIKNDFGLYMAYLLNYSMKYNQIEVKVDNEGREEESKKLVYVLDSSDELSEMIKERCLATYQANLKTIMETDTGIPIAPLDQIKQIIKASGFKVDEITGRQRCISFEKGDFSEGVIEKREIKKTEIIVREFNENEIDCLLINQSGAVGISMHSAPNKKANIVYKPNLGEDGKPLKDEDGNIIDNAPTTLANKAEVKKRAMVVTQMDLDINKEVQKLGRINRTGQVYQPEYTYIVSAIPSESRLTSLMEKKLKSLSANVSSNSTQASYLFTADDFFSDVAVAPFNETMQSVGMRNISATVGSQIQDFTKSLYFEKYELQRDFYDTFSKLLTKEIETLTAQGLYTGKMSFKEYYAQTKGTFPFFIGDNNAKTSFGRHSFIEKASVTLYKQKHTEKDISILVNDKLTLKGAEGKDDLFFSKLPAFQTKAVERLDLFLQQREEKLIKYINEIDENVATITSKLNEGKTELSKFSKLEEALAVEEELKKLNDIISENNKKISELAVAGDMEGIQKVAGENAPHIVAKKTVEEKLKGFEEILKTKADHRELLRSIKRHESDLDRIEKGRASHYSDIEAFRKLVVRGKDYLSKIGTMQQLNVSEEQEIYHEGTYELKEAKYTPKHSEPVVLTGISFPAHEEDLTAGKFEIFVCGVAEKYSYNLYQLHKEYSEEEVTKGYKAKVTLKLLDADYKGKWNEIAGKVDNSYREDRFIIIGSLLRTFSLANNNDITGQIVKYNTEEGKVRIGIEVADNKDLTENKKSVYKVLQERYNDETALNYPVYYDGNRANVDRYITQYIYDNLFGKLKEHVEKKIPVSEMKINRVVTSSSATHSFQISTSERQIFVVVRPNDEQITLANKLTTLYLDGSKDNILAQIPEREDMERHLHVRILSDAVIATDFFALHLQGMKVEITDDNYIIQGKSKYFPNLTPRKYSSGRLGTHRFGDGSNLFKTMFPTNIISIENILTYGFEYLGDLRMQYSQFMQLINMFEKKRRKPTFATGSDYFEKYRNEYVFEQFADEDEKPVVVGDTVVAFESQESESDKEISTMIDELVEMLKNK